MPICPLCDDTGLQNSDAAHPEFCYCPAGKQAKRQWQAGKTTERPGKEAPRPASFIDIGQLDQVNASVDAMRASLFGPVSSEHAAPSRHPAVQLLFRVAHPGHEITVSEATQLHDLAQVLESFLGGIAPIGRKQRSE
ncbi:MAG: hypothetical protein IMW89_12275 [Ktedonobacteraceae bacterium]|nr:hypothetical protein [Ktedonobacteraceae bacterium]